jgi:hypothetical protein
MAAAKPRKLVRSYRLVFRRRWRIFRIQGWRIPLPGGLELRLLGYWLACLAAAFLAACLPLLGALIALAPDSVRLLALPLAAAWGLSRWEVDGRPPHRALLGLLAWRLRPRHLAALRRCPPPAAGLAPLGELSLAPDLTSAEYPRGRVRGPARLLLRYPVAVEAASPSFLGRRPGRTWRIRPLDRPPLQSGKTIEVPAGATVLFEGARR